MSKDKNFKTIPGWVRPLSLPSLGGFPFGPVDKPINPYSLVKDLCQDSSDDFLEKIRERYQKLTTNELDIFVVPAEKMILEKLVWPLKAAKQAFILGNFIGCISLCGVVCEMAVIFLFDLIKKDVEGKILSKKYQTLLFGREFEKLGQKRRIDILSALGILSKEMEENANIVRKIRNDYLHYLSKDYSNITKDAEDAYKSSFIIIKNLAELPIGTEGSFKIPNHLLKHLKSILSEDVNS